MCHTYFNLKDKPFTVLHTSCFNNRILDVLFIEIFSVWDGSRLILDVPRNITAQCSKGHRSYPMMWCLFVNISFKLPLVKDFYIICNYIWWETSSRRGSGFCINFGLIFKVILKYIYTNISSIFELSQ